MKRILLIVILLGAVVAAGVYWYVNNKPHRSIAAEEAVAVTAVELFDQYQQNENAANEKFLNKAVRVTGKISSVIGGPNGNTVIVLETNDSLFGINCTLDKATTSAVGDTVTITGLCTGYLSDVILINGVQQ